MTFSREPYRHAISRNEKIGAHEIAYFQQRLKNTVFSKIVEVFAGRAEADGLTKGKLATLTGKDPAVVNRLLSLPSNLTLETLSDLALAMGCEPEIYLAAFENPPRHNFTHEWMREFVNDGGVGVRLSPESKGYISLPEPKPVRELETPDA